MEQSLNMFLTHFKCYISVIKYLKNNSKNVELNYFRNNKHNKHSVKILSKTNCKLKRYRIFSLEIQNTKKIIRNKRVGVICN